MSEPEKDDDRSRAEIARGLLEFQERMQSPAFADMLGVQAKLARMRYQAMVQCGFSEAQALELCTRNVQLG